MADTLAEYVASLKAELDSIGREESALSEQLARARERRALVDDRLAHAESWRSGRPSAEAGEAAASTGDVVTTDARLWKGRPARWAIIKKVCDSMPGRVLERKAILERAQRDFPEAGVTSDFLARDMRRKPHYWTSADDGFVECIWKKGNGV